MALVRPITTHQLLRENLWCPALYLPALFAEGRVKKDGEPIRDGKEPVGPLHVVEVDGVRVPWSRPPVELAQRPTVILHNKVVQDQSIKYSGPGNPTIHARLLRTFPEHAARLLPVNPLVKRWAGLMLLTDMPLFTGFLIPRLPMHYILRTTTPIPKYIRDKLLLPPDIGKLPLCERIGDSKPSPTDERPFFSQTVQMSNPYSQRAMMDVLIANRIVVQACYCVRVGEYKLAQYVKSHGLHWGESIQPEWTPEMQRHWEAFVRKIAEASTVRLASSGRLVIDDVPDTP